MTDKCIQSSCLIFLTMFCLSVKSCEELEILSPVEDTVIATLNDWVDLTFKLNAKKCDDQTFVVSVERTGTQVNGSVELVCRFMLNGTSCRLSDNVITDRCRCETSTDRATFFTRLEEPGQNVYRWRWLRKDSKQRGEKKINVYVAAETQRDQILKYIMGGVCGFLLLTDVLVLIVARSLTLSALTGRSHRKSEAETLHNDETQAQISDIQVCAENCQQEVGDGCSILPQDLYARLSYSRKTPPANQRAVTEPIEMTINVLYEDKSIRQ